MACEKKIVVEVAVIVAVIAVIWCLMSLPVIFYYLPQQSSSTLTAGIDPLLVCTPTDYTYTGGVCKDTLLTLKQCIFNQQPGNTEDVKLNISAAFDSQISEQLTTIGVQYLDPSQECLAVLVPFFCQYLFTPCDERGVPYYPSSEDCVYIRDQVCAREWEEITRIPNVVDYLPNCESLPIVSTVCNLDLPVTAANGSTDSTNVSSPLMCSEGFVYIEEVHQCRPHCPSWEEHEPDVSTAYRVSFATSAAVSVLASIAVLFLTCVRYKRMFTFPSVFIVYQVIALLVLEVTFLIGFTDKEALFCSSQDWLEVLNTRGTPFCTFSGIVYFYAVCQTTLWWLFHISAMFCEIKFPLRTHSFKALGHMKYIHIGLVIAGILTPVIPVTATASVAGFYPAPFPPIFCYSASANAIFYGAVFPSCISGAIGISLLVCIVWLITKGYCRYDRSERAKRDAKVVTAKLLILFCYFTLFSVVSLIAFAVNTRITPQFYEALFLYFHCESNPTDMECDRKSFQQHTIVSLTLVANTLLNIYPLTCLLYAVNITELKDNILKTCHKFKNNLRNEHPTVKCVNNQLQPPALELRTTDSAATMHTSASINFEV